MKAHAQRMARLQLIASMLEGQSWQQAMANADLSIGRSTAYRLVQFARDPERSERPFLERQARPRVQADGTDAPLDCGVLHTASRCLFEPGQSRTPSAVWPGGQPWAY